VTVMRNQNGVVVEMKSTNPGASQARRRGYSTEPREVAPGRGASTAIVAALRVAVEATRRRQTERSTLQTGGWWRFAAVSASHGARRSAVAEREARRARRVVRNLRRADGIWAAAWAVRASRRPLEGGPSCWRHRQRRRRGRRVGISVRVGALRSRDRDLGLVTGILEILGAVWPPAAWRRTGSRRLRCMAIFLAVLILSVPYALTANWWTRSACTCSSSASWSRWRPSRFGK